MGSEVRKGKTVPVFAILWRPQNAARFDTNVADDFVVAIDDFVVLKLAWAERIHCHAFLLTVSDAENGIGAERLN
jgi:hypothetical protein